MRLLLCHSLLFRHPVQAPRRFFMMATAPQAEAAWEFYRSLGSPKYLIAPMVDASELAWRMLSRLHGAELCYTPMIHAHLFPQPSVQEGYFSLSKGEEGSSFDRPLVAQFCANDPEIWENSASILAERQACDAIDLNLGCPQGIAKRGEYGAFLMEKRERVKDMISRLAGSKKLKGTPILAKFRRLETIEKTVEYAKMLEAAGASWVVLHGRTKEMKGQYTGLADWDHVRAVKAALSIPVFSNGNILTHQDVVRCLAYTSCDGVMSAEGSLYNPSIFAPLDRDGSISKQFLCSIPGDLRDALESIKRHMSMQVPSTERDRQTNIFPPIIFITRQYLAIVRHLKTPTPTSSQRGHLFKIWKPVLVRDDYSDIRDRLSSVHEFEELTDELEQRLKDDVVAGRLPDALSVYLPLNGDSIPYSHCQPYIRPLPPDISTQTATMINALQPLVELLHRTICSSPDCQNMSGTKCSRGMCKTCCEIAWEGSSVCGFHMQRKVKRAELAAEKKERKKRKRDEIIGGPRKREKVATL
ncbi:FMN-linked oxidoreductase [Atractiella rhizophila]|nr:FMN-linked oxidoreductase [Atractiella rhizophila]